MESKTNVVNDLAVSNLSKTLLNRSGSDSGFQHSVYSLCLITFSGHKQFKGKYTARGKDI